MGPRAGATAAVAGAATTETLAAAAGAGAALTGAGGVAARRASRIAAAAFTAAVFAGDAFAGAAFAGAAVSVGFATGGFVTTAFAAVFFDSAGFAAFVAVSRACADTVAGATAFLAADFVRRVVASAGTAARGAAADLRARVRLAGAAVFAVDLPRAGALAALLTVLAAFFAFFAALRAVVRPVAVAAAVVRAAVFPRAGALLPAAVLPAGGLAAALAVVAVALFLLVRDLAPLLAVEAEARAVDVVRLAPGFFWFCLVDGIRGTLLSRPAVETGRLLQSSRRAKERKPFDAGKSSDRSPKLEARASDGCGR
jgi:hypothetical protein